MSWLTKLFLIASVLSTLLMTASTVDASIKGRGGLATDYFDRGVLISSDQLAFGGIEYRLDRCLLTTRLADMAVGLEGKGKASCEFDFSEAFKDWTFKLNLEGRRYNRGASQGAQFAGFQLLNTNLILSFDIGQYLSESDSQLFNSSLEGFNFAYAHGQYEYEGFLLEAGKWFSNEKQFQGIHYGLGYFIDIVGFEFTTKLMVSDHQLSNDESLVLNVEKAIDLF